MNEMERIMQENTVDENLTEKLDRFFKLKLELKETNDRVSKLKDTIAKLETECFIEMEHSNIQNLKLGNTTFYRRTDMYASLKDKGDAFEWLEQNNLDHLITNTVNARTLSSEMKTFIEEGGETPDCINITTKNRVGMQTTRS